MQAVLVKMLLWTHLFAEREKSYSTCEGGVYARLINLCSSASEQLGAANTQRSRYCCQGYVTPLFVLFVVMASSVTWRQQPCLCVWFVGADAPGCINKSLKKSLIIYQKQIIFLRCLFPLQWLFVTLFPRSSLNRVCLQSSHVTCIDDVSGCMKTTFRWIKILEII